MGDLNSDPLLAKVPVHEGYKVLGGVVLYEKLGQGGMGAVYRGHHLRLDIDVAVKVLAIPPGILPEAAEPLRQRFLREAHMAASVKHQNLVRIYDVDCEGGVYYIVMEYVDGESAADRLERKGNLSEQEAVQICLGAAEGLAAAHGNGVVHRDAKPDNILIGRDGGVVVADLGLAKAFSGDSSDEALMLTQPQEAVGTPYYMSPEQFAALTVGPGSDVWSLGVTLYQLLIGSVPWTESSVFVLAAKVMSGPLPNPRQFRPDLSSGVCHVIERALKKDPTERYQDCGEMAEALRTHVDAVKSSESILPDDEAGATRMPVVSATPPPRRTLTLIAKFLLGGTEIEVKASGWLGALFRRFSGPRKRWAILTVVLVFALLTGAAGTAMRFLRQGRSEAGKGQARADLTGALGSQARSPGEKDDTERSRAPVDMEARPVVGRAGEASSMRSLTVLLGDNVSMEFVHIEPGRFIMGSDTGGQDTRPAYKVTITRGFYIGKHEVTRAQFAAYVRETGFKTDAEKYGSAHVWTTASGYTEKEGASWKNPGFPQTDGHPVVCVSWNDVVAFCKWLSRRIGRTSRLATEAEWEYVCRAGSAGKWCVGNDENRLPDSAWYQNNSGRYTHAVGRKRPNAWGLYDIHGNVWEWCADWYSGEYYQHTPREDPKGPRDGKHRVLRGGGWCSSADECRSAYRDGYAPANAYADTGFRAVMTQRP